MATRVSATIRPALARPMGRAFSKGAAGLQGKYALVFPGQGTQKVGMGRELCTQYPAANHVLQEVDEALGFKLSKVMFEGPDDKLILTENAQPAILAHSIALLEAVKTQHPDIVTGASYVLGHSLGEYSALVAAGALPLAKAAQLVRARGQAMQKCVGPRGVGMVAMMPCSPNMASEIAEEARRVAGMGEVCCVANINSPGQATISGTRKAVDEAVRIAKAKRVRRCVELEVSCAFHSEVVLPAANQMEALLRDAPIKSPSPPLIANVTAQEVHDPATIRSLLVQQVAGAVLWAQSIAYCQQQIITSYIEFGDTSVLGALIRQCDKAAYTQVAGELLGKAEEESYPWGCPRSG
eukprot:comp21385_c0_seq1/m.29424 comp21385_c0_seq1/g.29424  ORF comp21385_c0_seq1/g.29424 comp21385_c0_seq1/m.29424 type:complete len:353 (-) comp21385_c0_seq1:675-1733(-)